MANNELDKEFVEKQKKRLDGLHAELVQVVHGLEDDQLSQSEDEGDFTEHDSGDMSQSLYDREVDATLEQTIENRLQYVERALQKVEEGTYGICDDTGEPIPRGRLEAMPEAIYTVEAQQRRERERRPPF